MPGRLCAVRGCFGISVIQDLPEGSGQEDVLHAACRFEERGDLPGREPRDAASDLCHEERQLRTSFRECDELLHIGADGLDIALHGGNGVAASLKSDALAPYGAEFPEREVRGSSGVHSGEVASEDEYLVFAEIGDMVGSDSFEVAGLFHFVRFFEGSDL